MPEDETKRPIKNTSAVLELAARLAEVPRGKDVADLPGESPLAHRARLHSGSPISFLKKAKSHQIKKNSKIFDCLKPYEDLLPSFDVEPKHPERLAQILLASGAKAKLYLNHYLEEAKLSGLILPDTQQPSLEQSAESFGKLCVAADKAGEPRTQTLPSLLPEEAAKALALFNAITLRRFPSRRVESIMAAGQDHPGAQASDIEVGTGSDMASLNGEEDLISDEDTLFGLACCAGFAELVQELIYLRGTTEFDGPHDCTPLMEACSAGKADVVRVLLDHHADVNAPSATNNTALIYAAASGSLECVKLLIGSGRCNLELRNENGHCALMEAASAGHLSIVEELVKSGALAVYMNTNSDFKVGLESPLTLAAYKGHVKLVEYLLSISSGSNRDEELHTALMEACMDGHTEVAELLLKHGAPVNLLSESFESPLTLASCGGHKILVKMLLDAGAHLEEPNDESYTPLMEASREGHTEVVELLLKRGANVNAQTDETGETAMTLAACSGHTEVLALLEKHGGNLELGASSPLVEASQEGHLETVKYMLEYAKRQKLNSFEWKTSLNTSLIVAAENGHYSITQALMEHGADPNFEVDNRNALMRAAKQGYTEVVTYLLEHGADANQKSTNMDTTSLVLASGSGHKEIVQLLLKHGANPGVVVKDGYTCVMDAAKHGHTEIVELLLDHEGTFLTNAHQMATSNTLAGLPPSPSTLPPTNPAQHARARRTNKKYQQVPSPTNPLSTPPNLTGKPRIEPPEPTRRVMHQHILGTLALDYGKDCDNDAVEPFVDLESFLGNGENLPEMLANYFTAFNEMTRRSESNGAEKEVIDNVLQQWIPYFRNLPPEAFRGRSPGGQLPGMQLSGTTTTTTSSFTTTDSASSAMTSFFHSAYENLKRNFSGMPIGRTGEAKTTEKKDVTKKPEAQFDKETVPLRPRTPGSATTSFLQQASKEPITLKMKGQIEESLSHLTPKQLMELHEAIFKCQPSDSASILKNNIENVLGRHSFPRENLKSYVDYIEDLKSRTVRRTQSESDAGKKSEITTAKIDPDDTLFKDVLGKIREYFQNTTFSGNNKANSAKVERNQPCKLSVDMMTESNHDTPLSFACQNGQTNVVLNLLHRGANKEHRDKKGFTPLILAASGGHVAVCQALIDAGADLEAQSERTKDTALSLACSSGRKEAVEYLLKKGADKEHRNVSDYTPLSLAASGGYVDIVTMLLDAGAEINSRTGSKLGISPLMLAAMNGHKDATRILLERGSDINAQIETNRNTALTLACFQGRTEVVRLLLQYNANVEHRAKTGLTPLMEAANGGYTEVGELLLDEGADPNTGPVPSSRDTALTIAADKGHDKFVEMLVLRHAQIDARNKKGCTALWLACNGGHQETVKILVENGADVDCADNRKVTPLMIAFRKGHLSVVKYMVQHVTQFPSDQDLDRYIATIVSTENELLLKCSDCRREIVCAKDKQSIEAAKAAEALLQMLEAEEEQLRTKKQAKQRKNEKKKAKKQAAKKTVDDEKGYDSDAETKEDKEEESGCTNDTKELPSSNILTLAYMASEDSNPSRPVPKPSIEERVPVVTPTSEIMPIISPAQIDISTSGTASMIERQKAKRAEKKEIQRERRRHESGKLLANHNAMCSLSPSQSQKSPIPNHSVSQNEEWVKANFKKSKGRMGVSSTRTLVQTTSGPIDSFFLDDAGIYAGWKDVELTRRRATIMSLSSSAIARVIGRGGSNINAIREATQASIEVEKQNPKKEQAERQITIRGTQETVKYAIQMINGLVIDQEASVNDIIRQVLRSGSASTGSAASSEGIKASNTGCPYSDFKTSPKMARAATSTASAAPAPTTNIWQQRMAARQKEEEARLHSVSPNGEVQQHLTKQDQSDELTDNKQTRIESTISDVARESGESSCLTTPSPPISPPLETLHTIPVTMPNPSGVISRPIRSEQSSAASSSGVSSDSSNFSIAGFASLNSSGAGQIFSSNILNDVTSLPSIMENSTIPATTKASSLLPSHLDILNDSSSPLSFTPIFPSFPTEVTKDNAFLPINNGSTLLSDERSNTPSISGLPPSIADIWSSASPISGEPWNSKLLMNGFGSSQSNIQDWGAAAAADPQLAFMQQGKQISNIGNAVNSNGARASSSQTSVFSHVTKEEPMDGWSSPTKFAANPQNGVGTNFGRPSSAAGGINYNAMSLTNQMPRTINPPQPTNRVQTPLSDQQFYSLAAQLAASQKAPNEQRSTTHTSTNFNGPPAGTIIGQKNYPQNYQAASQEYDALSQILQKSSFVTTQHHSIAGLGNNQPSDFQALRTSTRPAATYGYAGAPPPGFGPLRTDPPTTTPNMRTFTQYNPTITSNTIPPTQPTSHPGFPVYNAPPTTASTWTKPTPNPINGSHWTTGWN